MKKFLLLICMIIFTSLSANATTTVYYNSAGAATHTRFGAGPRISSNMMRANPHLNHMAMFSPPRPRYYGPRRYARNNFARPYGMVDPIMMPGYNNQVVMNASAASAPKTQEVTSRLSKNYQPRARKSYTRNGITYYN